MPPSAPPPPGSAVEDAFQAVYGAGSGRVASSDDGLLRGIAAYRAEEHWHLVTLGLAAIDPPRREGATSTGPLGHELSLIVPAAPSPPSWAFGLLDGAARTAVAVGRPFHAGARMAPGPPVDGAGSGLVAIAMRADPLVTAADVPVLQAVGVTQGEYLLMQRVGTALVLEKLAARDRLLATDPARA